MIPARLVQIVDLLGVDVEAAGGDRVQQRLPHVRPCAVHEDHFHAGATAVNASEPGGELEAARASANDHDAVDAATTGDALTGSSWWSMYVRSYRSPRALAFVTDRARRPRDVVDTDVVARELDERALVDRLGNVGDVDDERVHRHSSYDRHAHSVDVCEPAIAKTAQVSIGVASRNGRNGRFLVCSPTMPVSDRCARVDRAHLDYLGLQSDDGPHDVVLARDRGNPVKRSAGTHEVELVVDSQEDAGGIRKRCPRVRKAGTRTNESLELQAVDR